MAYLAWVWLLSSAWIEPAAPTLDVLTFNTWHGLRTEGVWKFPGESRAHGAARLDWQLEQLRQIDADVLFLQEVNPVRRRSRLYAAELGYDEVHRVDSCGVKLGPLELPRNIHAGLAILARPELGLRAVGAERLSGACGCGERIGFQVVESRYALFAEIRFRDRRLLLVNTHLHEFPLGHTDLSARVEALRRGGFVTDEESRKIARRFARHRRRQQREIRALLSRLERLRARGEYAGVVLAGDFNAVPGSQVVRRILGHGLSLAQPATEELPPTLDPQANAVNHAIGRRRRPRYPAFGKSTLIELYADLGRQPRRIDHVFVSPELRPLRVARGLDDERNGVYASDHFAVLTTLELRGPR